LTHLESNAHCGATGSKLAPQVGLEPTTRALTVRCSTIELLRNLKWMRFYIGDTPSFVNTSRTWLAS
jgi:hypothetical protein